VKELLKLANICQSCHKNKHVSFFMGHGVNIHIGLNTKQTTTFVFLVKPADLTELIQVRPCPNGDPLSAGRQTE